MALDQPTLLRSDLNYDNATRWDLIRAAPTYENLRTVWLTWTIFAGIVAFVCLIFALGILSSPRIRNKSFNIYLVFLTLPDFFFSFNCSLTCGLNYATGYYYSKRHCEWQSWYCIFGFTANMWMNAVIANQMHKMLRLSNKRQRYRPPAPKRVCIHATLVYLYASFVASWTFFGEWLPHRANAAVGAACLPLAFSAGSALFFWLVFVPAMIGIPMAYVVYICVDIFRRRLLPLSGKTRFIALYFFKLITAFVAMWLPTVILIYVVPSRNYWVVIAGGTFSHLQGFVSASFGLAKPDIRKAVLNFVSCNCNDTDDILGAYSEFDFWILSSIRTSFPRRSFLSSSHLNIIKDLEEIECCEQAQQLEPEDTSALRHDSNNDPSSFHRSVIEEEESTPPKVAEQTESSGKVDNGPVPFEWINDNIAQDQHDVDESHENSDECNDDFA